MTHKIVACIDHPSYATTVTDYASWAALRLDAPLEFVHVLARRPGKAPTQAFGGNIGRGTRNSLFEELSSLDEQGGRIAYEGGRQLLEAVKKRAISNGVTSPVSNQYRGKLVDTLAELEAETGLFILGQRGNAEEAASKHIGGYLERVLRVLYRPILVAPKEFRIVHKAMVAFDGSMTTRKGVDMLATSPLFRGCDCHIVMVQTKFAANPAQLNWAKNTLQSAISSVTTHLVGREPEFSLVDYVRKHNIDIVVMGAYGHSRVRQLLVGSTTALIRATSVPLLLLR